MMVEKLLQLFIGEVDAQLLESVELRVGRGRVCVRLGSGYGW